MLEEILSADTLTESPAKCAQRGLFHPALTEQPVDDQQALAERERPRGKSATAVVDAYVDQSGLRADAFARPVNVGHVRTALGSRNDPGIVRLPPKVREHADFLSCASGFSRDLCGARRQQFGTLPPYRLTLTK